MKTTMMRPEHWDEVKSIYWSDIKTNQATFEESPPDSWENWSKKFLDDLSIVCIDGYNVLGCDLAGFYPRGLSRSR